MTITRCLLILSMLAWGPGYAQSCFDAYKNQMSDYSVSTSDDAFKSSLYEKMCDISSRSEKSNHGLTASFVGDILADIGFKSGTSSQSANNFCSTYKYDSQSASARFAFTRRVSEAATKGLEGCIQASASQVRVRTVTTVRSIDVNVDAPQLGSVTLLSGNFTSNLACTSITSVKAKPINTIPQITSRGSVSINCIRTPLSGGQDVNQNLVYDDAKLTINIQGIAPVVIELPASELLGRTMRVLLEAELASTKTQLAPYKVSVADHLLAGKQCVVAFTGLTQGANGREWDLLNWTGYFLTYSTGTGNYSYDGSTGIYGNIGTRNGQSIGDPRKGQLTMFTSPAMTFDNVGTLTYNNRNLGRIYCPL